MRKSPYSFSPENSKLESEPVPNLDVPIINIIKHAETNYSAQNELMAGIQAAERPLDHADFKKMVRDGKNKSELTQQGLADIEESAKQLAQAIDIENEVILIASSPLSRAWETAQEFLQKLQEQNPKIQIINPENVTEFWSLKGMVPKAAKLQDMELENAGGERKVQDQTISNWYLSGENRAKTFDTLEIDFNNFLRHAINFKRFMGPKSLDMLKGKKLRIVGFSHTEVPYRIIRHAFQKNRTTDDPKEFDLKHTQILEINPESELSKNGSTKLKIKIYPKGQGEIKEQNINFQFNPEEGN